MTAEPSRNCCESAAGGRSACGGQWLSPATHVFGTPGRPDPSISVQMSRAIWTASKHLIGKGKPRAVQIVQINARARAHARAYARPPAGARGRGGAHTRTRARVHLAHLDV
jgi:hypothetical protein